MTALSDQEIIQQVQQLLSSEEEGLKIVLLKEMLARVLKLYEDQVDLLDIKILNRAIKELRYAFQVFHAYSHAPKVSIYGSARTPPDDPNFKLASRFGRLLSQRGFMVITGAGDGIMLAGHEGAGKEHSFGVNIMLPFEQAPNAVIANDPKLVNLKYFFTRKLLFVKESHATALFPGGFGTMDEAFEVLTLIQTGKTPPSPVMCLQAPGCDYWDRWKGFITDDLLSRHLISESDLSLFSIYQDEESAVEEIQRFYSNYHSIRFIDGKLVIRFRYALSSEQLDRVNKEFQDLLASGTIEQCEPFPEEKNEPSLAHLSRLVLHYNRRSAGRLRELINWLNHQSPSHS